VPVQWSCVKSKEIACTEGAATNKPVTKSAATTMSLPILFMCSPTPKETDDSQLFVQQVLGQTAADNSVRFLDRFSTIVSVYGTYCEASFQLSFAARQPACGDVLTDRIELPEAIAFVTQN
jgi:hypothetical protein